ncbi:MAG TPA: hypothetical protein VK348_13750 [Planctomycetota bacterium]|nr:hypothetical protein [Planctomycetota bacterium]
MLLALGGCYASNVVARADRAVAVTDVAQLPWRAATAADFTGLFESVSIEGEVALALRRVWYLFEDGGRYAGAALVDTDAGPAFQTLAGNWRLGDDGLRLDAAAPATVAAAPEHLRLQGSTGVVVLRRVPQW